ncbi:MAG: hypothetical protein KZQ58_05915 [gamma proteobacterium symbiont of Bathyaustriella thionipta]|nr:hypothetical protein [gamma proteobacterium symbiont of Bathyaustriella thionipta]
MYKKITGLFMLLALIRTSNPVYADYPLEIIELQHQTAYQMIPLLQPFAGSKGVINGRGNTLIIKVAPQRLTDIRRIVDQFDRNPLQMDIYILQGQHSEAELQQLSAAIRARIGSHGRVRVGRPSGPSAASLHTDNIHLSADQRQGSADSPVTDRVRATEGMPAFIHSGVSVPLTIRQGAGYPVPHRWREQAYRDVSTGFYVTPRLNGDRVTLEINTRRDRLSPHPQAIRIQSASSTISGKTGEWISLGGIRSSRQQNERGLLYSDKGSNQSEQTI